eukprot:1797766-Alexandrium_andersonii.AAC.1
MAPGASAWWSWHMGGPNNYPLLRSREFRPRWGTLAIYPHAELPDIGLPSSLNSESMELRFI